VIIVKTFKRHPTVFFLCLTAVPLFAAKFWEEKDYTSWSDKDCREMLTKSPWAYTNSFGEVPPIGSQTGGIDSRSQGTGAPTWGEAESTQVFEFRFLTAKPIRMALARLQLLQRPGNAALLEEVKKYVDAPPEKDIVIQVTYRTFPPGSSAVHDIHSYFIGANLADFRTTTYLASDKAGMISLAAYLGPAPNRSNPSFVFPRLNDKGEPLFTGDEKSISFRSTLQPTVGGLRKKYDIFFKMNPKQMKFQNQFTL
jgi:hypothetical protein